LSPSQFIALLPETIGAVLAFALLSAAVGLCIACAGRPGVADAHDPGHGGGDGAGHGASHGGGH
jgi:hypothetical protein